MPFLSQENALIDTANAKIIFRRESKPVVIRKITCQSERSKLLRENTRLEHILESRIKDDLWTIIDRYQNIFHLNSDPLPCTTLTQHKIDTTDDKPINVKQYRYPPAHQMEIDRQINDMLGKEIITHSQSPYNSPLWVVPKKTDASGKKNGES
jgi:hypothetical protein